MLPEVARRERGPERTWGEGAATALASPGRCSSYFSICFCEPEPIAIFLGLIAAGFTGWRGTDQRITSVVIPTITSFCG
jgi:hypothetical protein